MACQEKNYENEKTVIELVHLIYLEASSCSLMHRRPKLIVCILYGTSGASDL